MISGKLFKEFLQSEKSSGIVLLLCTFLSLFIANSAGGIHYINFWGTTVNAHPLSHWINDGLMAIFFLLIGLELEREIYSGELSGIKKAAFPVIAAVGGMLVPAAIYFLINKNTPAVAGVGIPMATDIAFALGMLSLLGNRVPVSLKIFLTALAVIDDLGAILCIAIFYTKSIDWGNLGIALFIFTLLLLMNKLKIKNLIPYLLGGILMWYFMLHSGVHATISGVLLAFTIPFDKGDKSSSSYKLQHYLHWPVAFIILPVFALANTAIAFPDSWKNDLFAGNSIGIFTALVIGKPVGILLFTAAGVLFGICKLPKGLSWKLIAGAGILAGIGFTMSIFITMLAFSENTFIVSSKVAILFSSLIAAVIGLVFLFISSRKTKLLIG